MSFIETLNRRTVYAIGPGQLWEIKVFGCCSNQFYRPSYIPWQDAVLNARKLQKKLDWIPAKPKTEAALLLYEAVQKRLTLQHARKRLQLYCSIGTALDFWHGTDGFFSIDRCIVCIDLTANQKKAPAGRIFLFKSDHLKYGSDNLARKIAKAFNEYFTAVHA